MTIPYELLWYKKIEKMKTMKKPIEWIVIIYCKIWKDVRENLAEEAVVRIGSGGSAGATGRADHFAEDCEDLLPPPLSGLPFAAGGQKRTRFEAALAVGDVAAYTPKKAFAFSSSPQNDELMNFWQT